MPHFLGTSLAGFEVPAARPVASLVIVHGLAEHAGRYRDIAQAFAARGISCCVYDQRGHGASPGTRTHIERFDDYVTDLRTIGRNLSARDPQLPLFVWGHSMGSVVATLLAATAEPWLRGVITSSSSLEIFHARFSPLNPVVRLVARILPRIRIPLGLDGAKISSDPAIQRAYENDPLIAPTASLQLLIEFAAACELSSEQAGKITLPWLVTHGQADEIAPVAGSQVLFERLGSADKQLTLYPKLRHEMHNEKPADRAAFLQLLGDWIAERAR